MFLQIVPEQHYRSESISDGQTETGKRNAPKQKQKKLVNIYKK